MRNPYGGNGRATALKAAAVIVAVAYFGSDIADAMKPIAAWIMAIAATALLFGFLVNRFRR